MRKKKREISKFFLPLFLSPQGPSSAAKGLDLDWCKNCDRGLIRPDINIFMEIDEKIVKKRDDFGNEIYEKVRF